MSEFPMRNATRADIQAALDEAGVAGRARDVTRPTSPSMAGRGTCRIDLAGAGAGLTNDRASWSYDDLAKVSEMFDTRDINVRWEAGWGGTEETPGDPDEVWLEVSW